MKSKSEQATSSGGGGESKAGADRSRAQVLREGREQTGSLFLFGDGGVAKHCPFPF